MTTGEIPTLNATTHRAQPDTRGKRRAAGAADWGLKNRHNPRAITGLRRLRGRVRTRPEETP